MNKTRYLKIHFDKPFQSYNIRKLRAAIIEKTSRESDLFHNHLDDKKFIYRYPLIQYKIKDRKPCIVCLREATDDIHYLLKSKDFKFVIDGKKYEFEIEEVLLKFENIRTMDTDVKYNLHNYMALNQENYKKWQNLEGLAEKAGFLQGILKNHLSVFANEMEASIVHELSCKILDIKSEKHIEYKGVFHLTFSLNFKSNLHIPDYVGIGKGSSIGFGIVKKIDQ